MEITTDRFEVRELEFTGNFRIWDHLESSWIHNSNGQVFETSHRPGAYFVAGKLNRAKS